MEFEFMVLKLQISNHASDLSHHCHCPLTTATESPRKLLLLLGNEDDCSRQRHLAGTADGEKKDRCLSAEYGSQDCRHDTPNKFLHLHMNVASRNSRVARVIGYIL